MNAAACSVGSSQGGRTHPDKKSSSLLEVREEFVQYDVIAAVVVVVATAAAASLVDFLVFPFSFFVRPDFLLLLSFVVSSSTGGSLIDCY